MGAAIDQILRMQDTAMDERRRDTGIDVSWDGLSRGRCGAICSPAHDGAVSLQRSIGIIVTHLTQVMTGWSNQFSAPHPSRTDSGPPATPFPIIGTGGGA